jgi:hypothetical protein
MVFEKLVIQPLRQGRGSGNSVLARETGVSIKPRVPTLGQLIAAGIRAREAGDRDVATRLSPILRAPRYSLICCPRVDTLGFMLSPATRVQNSFMLSRTSEGFDNKVYARA